MESQTNLEVTEHHSLLEIGNVFKCARVEREWLANPDLPANYAITLLHATLLGDVEGYTHKGVSPNIPGDYRIEDIWVGDEPKNFYVRGLDVKFVMRDYAAKLEEVLQGLPAAPGSHVEKIINTAAWAYYCFIRIHPFLDGNGRVGRMILQRVLKGGGFKDIIFSSENGKNTKKSINNRDRQINTMKQVDKTGNLSALEVYIAEQLMGRYTADTNMTSELQKFIAQKNEDMKAQTRRLPLSNIWESFGNIDIAGNEIENHETI